MISDEQILQTLHDQFGYEQFRDGQKAVINSVLKHRDTMAVLPTGAGKTLLYQLPAYLISGTVVIVSPLLSLMQDQVSRLRERGEKKVVMLSSMQTVPQRKNSLARLSEYRFIFASPEILAQDNVIQSLRRINVSLFVIDEAHCISQWGPDFRPQYLLLNRLIESINHPAVLMLTATATKKVQDDIIDKLGLNIDDVERIIKSVNRENIFLTTEKVNSVQEKNERLAQLVQQIGGAGIIYFSSRKQASQCAQWLMDQTGLRIAAYHAGIDQVTRYKIQHQFMNNSLDVVCATNAFGMGIDKNDIRFVIHYHLPANLENYVQEIGRAGRDGKQSIAILMYADGDEQIQRQLGLANLPNNLMIEKFARHQITPDGLGEMGDVLNFYIDNGYPVSEIESIFKKRAFQSEVNLSEMVNYAKANECLRNKILQYFDEQKIVHNVNCCSLGIDTEQIARLGLDRRNKKNKNDGSVDWHQRLDELFFEKS